jgi:hypothetical protein
MSRMLSRQARPLWIGLAASSLLHTALLTSGLIVLPAAWEDMDAPPIEARLELPLPTPPLSETVAPRQPSAKAKPVARPRRVVAQVEPSPSFSPDVAGPESPATPVEPAPPAPPPEPTAQVTQPAEPPAAALPPPEPAVKLNSLPRRIEVEYRINYGPAGGKQTLLWINEGGRYTITTVAAATGFASVFYSGQFVQTSQGRITALGLEPEEYWEQRGNKRAQARFDYENRSILVESRKGPRTIPLPEGTQDALSLLFQMALTAPPPQNGQSTLFNGRKVRSYRYQVAGEETLETGLGALRTLHLIRTPAVGEDRFEIWLAIDRHYLPVRILRTEGSGIDGELLAERISSVD